MSKVYERKAEGEIPYKVLKTPCSVTFIPHSFTTQDVGGGYLVHHLYVTCKELQEKFLPLDANPREPAVTTQVKAMQSCLKDRPGDFVKKNNGLTTICECVGVEDKTKHVTVEFATGEGVCNGGHTYFAIQNVGETISDTAIVHLELIQLPKGLTPEQKREQITEIARARNANNRLAQYSEADFMKYYLPFKEKLLNSKWVSWHEGDSEALDTSLRADDFLRFLAALDPKKYRHPEYSPEEKRHVLAVTNGKAINREWFEATEDYYDKGAIGLAPLSHMSVLSNDILKLRDSIAESFLKPHKGGFRKSKLYETQIKNKKHKLLTDPKREGFFPSITLEIMIAGLFRTDIWMHLNELATIDLIGWVHSPTKIWETRKQEVLEGLAAAYHDQDDDPIHFIRSDAPYRHDLFSLGMGQEFPKDPEIIYRISDGKRFLKTDDKDSATHCLDYNDKGMLTLFDPEKPLANKILYREEL